MKTALFANFILTNKPHQRFLSPGLVDYISYMKQLILSDVLESSDKRKVALLMLESLLDSNNFDGGYICVQDDLSGVPLLETNLVRNKASFLYRGKRETSLENILELVKSLRDDGYQWIYYCPNHDHISIGNVNCLLNFFLR